MLERGRIGPWKTESRWVRRLLVAADRIDTCRKAVDRWPTPNGCCWNQLFRGEINLVGQAVNSVVFERTGPVTYDNLVASVEIAEKLCAAAEHANLMSVA